MMNERFKKLGERAGLFTGWVNGECEYQKFAELIVRECMDICYRTDTSYEGKKVRATLIASKVAEHFGVNE